MSPSKISCSEAKVIVLVIPLVKDIDLIPLYFPNLRLNHIAPNLPSVMKNKDIAAVAVVWDLDPKNILDCNMIICSITKLDHDHRVHFMR